MPITPLDCAPEDLSIIIEPAPARSETQPEIEARWVDLCAQSHRLYNATILAFKNFDSATSTITSELSDFKRLAVQPQVQTGTTILSVTGVLTATTNDGQRCVCVAKRAHNTRIYGGMWELAPSGGVDVPTTLNSTAPTRFDAKLAANALHTELHEELGLSAHDSCDLAHARIIGLVLDEHANSLDIMFLVEHRSTIQPGPWAIPLSDESKSWEYDEIRWVMLDTVDAFVRTNPCIPPMIEAARAGLIR